MPGSSNLPPSSVQVTTCCPVCVCTKSTVAPGIGTPCAERTTPESLILAATDAAVDACGNCGCCAARESLPRRTESTMQRTLRGTTVHAARCKGLLGVVDFLNDCNAFSTAIRLPLDGSCGSAAFKPTDLLIVA